MGMIPRYFHQQKLLESLLLVVTNVNIILVMLLKSDQHFLTENTEFILRTKFLSKESKI